MALALGKTPFSPFVTIVGGFQNRFLIVPVTEHVTGYIVRIYVFRILKPFMMQNF